MLQLFLFLLFAYLLALMCRRGAPKLKELAAWNYAHRGLHGDGLPENSMGAFQAALEAGYGIELDLHLLADGNLAVIHDSLLNRTTGQPGRIEDLRTEDLKNYTLEGTQETIPTFSQVLELFAGKAPMIIELKAENGNHNQLAQTACEMLEGYEGLYCIESFDPRCLMWLRKHRPDIVRGQLAQNFFRGKNDLPDYQKFLLTNCLMNFLTYPDFIAYCFSHRGNISAKLCRMTWGVQGVAWTLRKQEDFDTAKKEGWIPIFEGFRP